MEIGDRRLAGNLALLKPGDEVHGFGADRALAAPDPATEKPSREAPREAVHVDEAGFGLAANERGGDRQRCGLLQFGTAWLGV